MIFVDTSAFYALLLPGDASHKSALAKWTHLHGAREALHTTNYVVVETVSLLQRRAGVEAIRRFHDLLAVVQVHFVEPAVHDASLDLFVTESRRQLSLVDCSSFAFMRRAGIRRAFAFDDDFKRMGFEPV